MTAQADQLTPTSAPVSRLRGGRPGSPARPASPARSARITVEIDLAGGRAPGVASALCAEISDLLAGHARSGDTSVSASVSLGFGDAVARPAPAEPPLFSTGTAEGPDAGAGGAGAGAGTHGVRAGSVGLRIVAGRRVAIQDGVDLPLTRREFDLLSFLARNPRRVFSRGQLIDAVWGARYRDSERTIDVHVRRIRVKLSPTGPRIVTVRGVGYRLDHPERVTVVPGVE